MSRAVEVFETVLSYWRETCKKAVDSFPSDPTEKNYADLGGVLHKVVNDEIVGGVSFSARSMRIDGHDKDCVEGTILDVKDPKSDTYRYYRQVVCCAKNLLAFGEGRPRYDHLCASMCEGSCVGSKIDPASCVVCVRHAVDVMLCKEGSLEKSIEKADKGDWKAK